MPFFVMRISQLLKHLIAEERHEQAAEKILQLTLQIESQTQWKPLLDSLELIPLEIRQTVPVVAMAYSHVLMGNRQINELLEFTNLIGNFFTLEVNAQITVDRAFVLLIQNKNQEVKNTLLTALPFLNNHFRGVALRRLGIAHFRLGQPWQVFFEQALELQTGRARGLTLLDYAGCLTMNKQPQEAQTLYNQALNYFEKDIFHLAWLRFNLGNNALAELNPEAEAHFLEGERLSRSPDAKGLRSAILRGLATFRRSKGEFARAEFLLLKAIQAATETDDDLSSRQGYARTLRLAGRTQAALETIETAILKHGAIPHLLVTRAITYLARGFDQQAIQDLVAAQPLPEQSSQHLVCIIKAELARRNGQIQEAQDWLEQLPSDSLHIREECLAFPELFALAKIPFGLLEYHSQYQIRVVPEKVLQVQVNQRPVPITPTSRVAELLVFMLEKNGLVALEVLMDALYPNAIEPLEKNRARKAIWKLSQELRSALGWQNSIIALRGAYQLDPNAIWDYPKETNNSRFLEGIYSDWVLEKQII